MRIVSGGIPSRGVGIGIGRHGVRQHVLGAALHRTTDGSLMACSTVVDSDPAESGFKSATGT
jgi:hypothetical protein